jgi:hypothetical protein
VRTDHYSLKYLLDQRLSTIPQHQWVSKLFGYDFSVEYRSGKNNAAANALSRRLMSRLMSEPSLHALSGPWFDIFEKLR